MRVEIDKGRCTGHGRCYEVAPELFVDDEDGYGQVSVDQVSDELVAAARRAINSCPEHAISIVD